MKKLLFLSVGVFLSLFLAGCGDDEEETKPEPITEVSTTSFMNEEWPEYSWNNRGFFKCNDTETFFKVINSEDDFKDFYIGNKQLPKIDFQDSTLIIGQVQVPHTGHEIKEIELVESSPLALNIHIEDHGAGYDMISALRFWKLYPKVSDEISMNIIKTKVQE